MHQNSNCYVCKEKGHIASECPKNPNGVYPNGGGCRFCGSNKHFVKDCKRSSEVSNASAVGFEADDDMLAPDMYYSQLALKRAQNAKQKKSQKATSKIVKF